MRLQRLAHQPTSPDPLELQGVFFFMSKLVFYRAKLLVSVILKSEEISFETETRRIEKKYRKDEKSFWCFLVLQLQ